jgi:hypothetical protein
VSMRLVLNILAGPHERFGSTQRDNYLTLRTVLGLARSIFGLLLIVLRDKLFNI